MDSLKLQTFLAHAGIASRRKAEVLISEGKVVVNGEVAHLGQRIIPEKDEVIVEGKIINTKEPRSVYLIYKPVGVVSTTSDELGRLNVVDFLKQNLPETASFPRLYPVGRLDLDSEGLMIITNDGELAQKMTHPSYEVAKTYRITVTGHPTEKALAHLEKGVMLREGLTSPAQVTVVEHLPDETIMDITIHEGRNHQVKRMLKRVGYEVIRLIRTHMGEYSLADLKDQPVKQIQ